ncbi:MAG: hypothetical protein RIQ46_2113 [Pseudomonadota bacterium]|jgi:hypothetical protein
MRALPLLAVMSAALAACSGSPEGNAEGSPATAGKSLFQAEIAPLLASNCATCHLTGQEAGNMALIPAKAIESLVGVKSVEAPNLMRVVPGDPDTSYLVMKLEGTHMARGGTGAQMPFGAPPLPKEKIAKVRQWIAEGAKP